MFYEIITTLTTLTGISVLIKSLAKNKTESIEYEEIEITEFVDLWSDYNSDSECNSECDSEYDSGCE